MFYLSPIWLTSAIILAAFAILYPPTLALLARQRLDVSWRYFTYGLLIFLLYLVATFIIGQTVPQPAVGSALYIPWLVALSLVVGLLEEGGRYLGYRWLMRHEEKTWDKAVMYGLGQGGLESMLAVGGSTILQILNYNTLAGTDRKSLSAPVLKLYTDFFNSLNAQPWLPLFGVWERLWSLPIQVAFAVIVLQVFRRGDLRWLLVAIAGHTVVDFITVETLSLPGANIIVLLFTELSLAIFGGVALWLIWRWREQSAETTPATLESEEDTEDQPEVVVVQATLNGKQQPAKGSVSEARNRARQPIRTDASTSKNVRRRQAQQRRKR